VDGIQETTGGVVPKRQIIEQTVKMSQDFDAFYRLPSPDQGSAGSYRSSLAFEECRSDHPDSFFAIQWRFRCLLEIPSGTRAPTQTTPVAMQPRLEIEVLS
jgi:hypothetical protein